MVSSNKSIVITGLKPCENENIAELTDLFTRSRESSGAAND